MTPRPHTVEELKEWDHDTLAQFAYDLRVDNIILQEENKTLLRTWRAEVTRKEELT